MQCHVSSISKSMKLTLLSSLCHLRKIPLDSLPLALSSSCFFSSSKLWNVMSFLYLITNKILLCYHIISFINIIFIYVYNIHIYNYNIHVRSINVCITYTKYPFVFMKYFCSNHYSLFSPYHLNLSSEKKFRVLSLIA